MHLRIVNDHTLHPPALNVSTLRSSLRMMVYTTNIILAVIIVPNFFALSEACTAAIFGRLATEDGSTYTASTADCDSCDFRLAKVPARDHPPNATRPIYLFKVDYPHVVQSARSSTWHPSNLAGSPRQLKAWTHDTQPIGFIPEVPHTFAVLEGGAGYALLNEYGVSIGESTCPSRFVSKPVSDGGAALLDVSELSRIGLERGKTAREVINIMGSLAEQYGYYGAEWDLEESKHEEAGEALMVADRTEAWVFHILPDDTGKSAVWAAQRVPDTDITVVANNFIMRGIHPKDNNRFMYSTNLYNVAQRNGLWKPGQVLDFLKTFGILRTPRHSSYSNIRVWRLFTLANPDLTNKLDPHANDWLDGYPFSVTPKKKLSRTDLFKMFRDHYEGSRFDMTKGEAGGPYGDPDRYDPEGIGSMSLERAMAGEFGRPVSMFRTSYTSITRSKASLPREIGSMMYFAPQQPSSSVFIPLYISLSDIPSVLSRGSLFRYSKDSMFWAVTGVSNWVHRYYKHAVGDLVQLQEELESYDVTAMDNTATKLLVAGRMDDAMEAIREFTHSIANKTQERYLDELPKLIGRYHDGYIVRGVDDLRINVQRMFYPEWWLTRVGYFAARETGGSYGGEFEPDVYAKPGDDNFRIGIPWLTVSFVTGAIVGGVLCVGFLHLTTDTFKGPGLKGYSSIP